jgi:hypothetical protein
MTEPGLTKAGLAGAGLAGAGLAGAGLERWYRRLLAWYPPGHRNTYGEEMIGVLLASARPGQRRPGIVDVLDLFGGGARVRLRALLTGHQDPGWKNALALASLLAPLLLVALSLRQNLYWIASLGWQTWSGELDLAAVAILLVPLALGLFGLRRVAAAAATALMVLLAVRAGIGRVLDDPRLAAYLVLFAIQAVALTISAGPRHALRLITPRGILIALPWIATAAYTGNLVPTSYPVPQVVARIAIVLIALAGVPALVMPDGRRLIVLIVAIPGSAFLATLLTSVNVQFYQLSFAAAMAALYLPPAFLAGLTILAVRRSRDHCAPPELGNAS